MLQVRVKDEMLIAADDVKCVDDDDDHEEEDNERKSKLRVCSSEELQKEYRQLVGCRARRWKPRLETVTETSLRSRRRTAGSSVMLLIRRRWRRRTVLAI